MVQTPTQPLTLEAFLQLPETKPASEFINNQITQKPMPQGEHSVLQGGLVSGVNAVAKTGKVAHAFPELRCVFGGAAIVPDVSVFRWQRIPRTSAGRVANRFEIPPDWAIEILFPEQSQTKVLAFLESRVKLYQGTEPLPVLQGINLALSAAEIFSWLALPE